MLEIKRAVLTERRHQQYYRTFASGEGAADCFSFLPVLFISKSLFILKIPVSHFGNILKIDLLGGN